MELVPIEIVQQILSVADFVSRIRLRCCTKLFHEKLQIHNFYDIPYNYYHRLSNKIIRNHSYIRRLNVENKSDITMISHLTNLRELNTVASGLSDRSGLCTNLRILCASDNGAISDITHLTKLKALYASGRSCGITDNSIITLTNLKYLSISSNDSIRNVNHLTKLELLFAHAYSNIDNNSIMNLTNLKRLDMFSNKYVTTISHLTNLTELDISYESAITSNEITKLCHCLKTLRINDNLQIFDIGYLTGLENLHAIGSLCTIVNSSLINLNLKILDCEDNESIQNIGHMINLEVLRSGGSSIISDQEIKFLTNLTELRVCDNQRITDIRHLTKLKILWCQYNSALSDDGITGLKLTTLYSIGNQKITKHIN